MKNIFIHIILLAFCSFGVYAQDDALSKVSSSIEMEPFTTGYINMSGDTIIPIGKYIHCYTEKFDKIAIVSIKNHSGFYAIDRLENILFEVMEYDNGPDPVNNGLFRIVSDDKIGYANMQGQVLIKPQFEVALPFSDGYAAFCVGVRDEKKGDHKKRVGGKWGYINEYGKAVIQPTFDAAYFFKNGKAKVRKEGKSYYINKTGVRVTEK